MGIYAHVSCVCLVHKHSILPSVYSSCSKTQLEYEIGIRHYLRMTLYTDWVIFTWGWFFFSESVLGKFLFMIYWEQVILLSKPKITLRAYMEVYVEIKKIAKQDHYSCHFHPLFTVGCCLTTSFFYYLFSLLLVSAFRFRSI